MTPRKPDKSEIYIFRASLHSQLPSNLTGIDIIVREETIGFFALALALAGSLGEEYVLAPRRGGCALLPDLTPLFSLHSSFLTHRSFILTHNEKIEHPHI